MWEFDMSKMEPKEVEDEEYDLEVDSEEELVEILTKMGYLPFDVSCVLTHDKTIFGSLGTGERIGEYAQYVGQPLLQTDEESDEEYEIDYFGLVGCIVGDDHDRIIIEIADDVYLGWINPDEYKLVQVFDGSNSLH